ncbi:MAG: hypothetical protein ABFD50_10515 [Smithella sp.]
MKKYLGVKIVHAEPMSEFDFLQMSGKAKSIVEQEFINREGYKVVYEDGYTSWSPKDVFEKAYKEISEEERRYKRIVIDKVSGEWDYWTEESQNGLKVETDTNKERLFSEKRIAIELAIKSLVTAPPRDGQLIERAKEIYKYLSE